jgi:DNA invertase Pin-like site-specific DNA recombinase
MKHRDEKILMDFPREFWEEQIERWVHDEQARYSIRRNFLDYVSYEAIAEELGISRNTVYKKVAVWSENLFKHCKL